jgi:hypothetical protein
MFSNLGLIRFRRTGFAPGFQRSNQYPPRCATNSLTKPNVNIWHFREDF